jgi:hypothetical protein
VGADVAAVVLSAVLVVVVCLQLLPYLQEKRVGVISAAPLCMGLWRPQASWTWNAERTLRPWNALCGSQN